MKARRYYLFKRNKIYYAQLRNPLTGQLMTAKSTGKQDIDDATFTALSWLKNEIPTGRTRTKTKPEQAFKTDELFYRLRTMELTEDDTVRIIQILKDRGLIADAQQKRDSLTLITFLTDFWTYEKSLYVKEKLSHGHSISKPYTNNMLILLKRYWKPYFKDIAISELTREDLQKFSIHLTTLKHTAPSWKHSGKTISFQTINHILKVGTTALKWAHNNGMIPSNPMANLMKFSGKKQKRGILTDKEIKAIFTEAEWTGSIGNKICSILACQTGLRLGELIALRVQDIGKDRIYVRHSWNPTIGLKSPKNGETREIPLMPETRSMVLDYAKKNPHGYTPESFIFWSTEYTDQPQTGRTIAAAFNRALCNIGIDNKKRKARGLTFHGLRHFYAKKMAAVLDMRTMKLTGHKSKSMLEHYADHIEDTDFKKAIDATGQVFGKILQFKTEATA